jgi:hypothetical protein
MATARFIVRSGREASTMTSAPTAAKMPATRAQRAREGAEERQRARERERVGVLAREHARQRPTRDVLVEADVLRDGTRARIAGEEEERSRRDGEQRRCRTRRTDATREHVCADREHERAGNRAELERDVVGKDNVEREDQQRRHREVELAGGEPGVEVG